MLHVHSNIRLSKEERELWPECDPWSEKCLLPEPGEGIAFTTREYITDYDGSRKMVTSAGVKNRDCEQYGSQELFAMDQVIELQRKTWKRAVSWARKSTLHISEASAEKQLLVKFMHTSEEGQSYEGLFVMFEQDFYRMLEKTFYIGPYTYVASEKDFQILSDDPQLTAQMHALARKNGGITGINPNDYRQQSS